MTNELDVRWLDDDRHLISVHGHQLIVDQPASAGGGDAGPTPVELFAASLASCVAHYARRALGTNGGGPSVHCTWTMSEVAPWRVTGIDIDVDLPLGTSPARQAAVDRATAHCTVHNTLKDPPAVRVHSAVHDLTAAR